MKNEQREEEIKNAVAEIDPEVEAWRKKAGAKRCTRCKFIVFKNDGCNHMTCRCGYEFCYVCGGKHQDCECTRKETARVADERDRAEQIIRAEVRR